MPFLFPSGLAAPPGLTPLTPTLALHACLLYSCDFAFSPAAEAAPCPFSGSLSPCMPAEISSPPAPSFSLGGTELPPSYEDVMKENKL